MTDVTSDATQKGLTPNAGKKMTYFEVNADADDTVDVSNLDEPINSVDLVYCYDQAAGEQVSTSVSGTTITLDASGDASGADIAVLVVGDA